MARVNFKYEFHMFKGTEGKLYIPNCRPEKNFLQQYEDLPDWR